VRRSCRCHERRRCPRADWPGLVPPGGQWEASTWGNEAHDSSVGLKALNFRRGACGAEQQVTQHQPWYENVTWDAPSS
jgi:hypothetical protein